MIQKYNKIEEIKKGIVRKTKTYNNNRKYEGGTGTIMSAVFVGFEL